MATTSASSKLSVQTGVTKDFPISAMGVLYHIHMGDLSAWKTISVQVQHKDATGTLNGTISLQQTNDLSMDWEDMGVSATIDDVSGSDTLQSFEFCGRYLRLQVVPNGITGGSISVELIVKRN